MNNEVVSDRLSLLAQLHELDEEPWRARAYAKAAESVRELDVDIGSIDPVTLPGIGEGIARKIREILVTGTCAELENRLVPDFWGLRSMTAVDGVGIRTAMRLFKANGIGNLDELIAAAKAGHLPHKLTTSVLACAERKNRRVKREDAAPIIVSMVSEIRMVFGNDARVEPAGSFRRCAPTIGDVDLLIETDRPASELRDTAKKFGLPLSSGRSKVTLRLADLPCNADWRVIPAQSWGAALCYFTGSREHNIAMRQRAKSKGMLLNEYGLWKGTQRVAGETEESVYSALDVPFRVPSARDVATV